MTSRAVRLSYAIVVAFFACLAVALASVAYSSYVQRESERKFCDLVITQDDAWSETTPTTATGKRVAAAIAKLRRDLGCPPP